MELLKTSLELVKWGIFSGTFLGISIAFTGPFLVLRKNALFPHSLTHILFLALMIISVITQVLPDFCYYPLIILLTLLTVFIMWNFKKLLLFYEDTTTSIITHLALALALVIAAKSFQYDTRLFSYLFGSLLTVTFKDVCESLIILILTFIFYFRFKEIWITQVIDLEVPGIDFKWGNLFFLLLITLQTLIGIKILGILLISSFFIFSSAVALRITNSFRSVVIITAFLNFLALLGGLLISFIWDIPYSASTVIFMSIYFFVLLLLDIFKKTRSKENSI